MNLWSLPAQPQPEVGDVLTRRTARVRSVELSGPAGRLEAVLNQGSERARFAALVCHPHPLGGGTLHNKVVYNAMKVLNAPAWGFEAPVLRFNFRGVGLSQGEHDGQAEAGDVLAALRWLEAEFRLPLVAAGFSFGAAMTLAALCGPDAPASVKAIACFGLPVEAESRRYTYPGLESLKLPKLFLSGDSDEFASASDLARVTAQAAEPKQMAFIRDADHFFTGRIEPFQQALAGWLREQFHDPGR